MGRDFVGRRAMIGGQAALHLQPQVAQLLFQFGDALLLLRNGAVEFLEQVLAETQLDLDFGEPGFVHGAGSGRGTHGHPHAAALDHLAGADLGGLAALDGAVNTDLAGGHQMLALPPAVGNAGELEQVAKADMVAAQHQFADWRGSVGDGIVGRLRHPAMILEPAREPPAAYAFETVMTTWKAAAALRSHMLMFPMLIFPMHWIKPPVSRRLAAAALSSALVAGCSTPPSPPDDSSPVAAPAAAQTPVAAATPVPSTAAPPATDAGPARPAPAAPLKTEKPATAKPAAKPPAPVAAKPAPAAPTLALDTLEQRLKDTPAIGTFTKLTLKNQVDDLLERFRDHYAGRGGSSLAQLRQSYEQLLAKVHGLLKDGDPGLAVAIINSREAIWGVLADPAKFAKL